MVAPKGRGAAKRPKLTETQPSKTKTSFIPSINQNVDGLYVPVHIQDKEYKFLVDTGASDSYISRRSYEQLDEKDRPPLQHRSISAQLADGSPLAIYGAITHEMKIGPK